MDWALGMFACGGAGPYGYARSYEPLDDEEDAYERAIELSYEEVKREPEDFRETTLAWFGVVTEIQEEGSDLTLHLTYRALAARIYARRASKFMQSHGFRSSWWNFSGSAYTT